MQLNNYSMLNGSNSIIKSMNKNNQQQQQSVLMQSQQQQNKRTDLVPHQNHPNPPSKPPPTLPKPKFILPQTSATNLVLQRSLKSKSELNIATTPCSSCSNESSAASSSSSSSCCSKSNQEATQNTNPPQQQQKTSNGSVPLRNKLLENSSLVSSSQGYHSDTWESHSSRQSFDLDSHPPTSTSSFVNQNQQPQTSVLG